MDATRTRRRLTRRIERDSDRRTGAVWEPNALQRRFIDLPNRNVLMGGEAGSGKTVALCFALLAPVAKPGEPAEHPHYRALALSQTEQALVASGGVLDVCRDMRPDAAYNAARRVMRFKTGERIQFGTLPDSQSHLRFQGQSYHTIALDEAGLMYPSQIGWLPRSLRKRKGDKLPLRYRMTANPGGRANWWLRDRYVKSDNSENATNFYLHAKREDNIALDAASYEASFLDMDELERRRQQEGDWDAMGECYLDVGLIQRFSGEVAYDYRIRSWDLAATDGVGDYTAGILVGVVGAITPHIYIDNIIRLRTDADGVLNAVMDTAREDGAACGVLLERQVAAAGKLLDRDMRRRLNAIDRDMISFKPTKDKLARAILLAGAMGDGRVHIRTPMPHRQELLDELAGFPDAPHDDMLDALAQAVIMAQDPGAVD